MNSERSKSLNTLLLPPISSTGLQYDIMKATHGNQHPLTSDLIRMWEECRVEMDCAEQPALARGFKKSKAVQKVVHVVVLHIMVIKSCVMICGNKMIISWSYASPPSPHLVFICFPSVPCSSK